MKQAPRILIIDDDANLFKLLALLLRRISAECIAAKDGSSGLEAIKVQQPDLVILDLMLPDIHGIEVLRQMRMRREFDRIPALILSAITDPSAIRQGLENGADGYVTKPYDPRDLLKEITALLQSPRREPLP